MKSACVLTLVALAGCAGSPDYVARQSNFDVCRLSMGGPHAAYADAEARNRGLDCRAYYGAILARQQQENAATQQYINSLRAAPPVTCRSVRMGNTVNTVCE